MKNLLCCLIGVFIISSINAQLLYVFDAKSEKALPLVAISSINPKAFALTNDNGETKLAQFKDAQLIEFRLLGYETARYSYEELNTLQFKVGLAKANFNLDEVVVSATRWEQASDKIPSKIIQISQTNNELFQPQTTADLLQSSGKVYVQKSQQGGGSPMIRGFATNRLLYTVDGIRMNSAIFRGGNIQNVINVDAYTLANTEVLFGPGSVIYGSDAIGGVMSFNTLTPEVSNTDSLIVNGQVNTRFSTANQEKTAHAHLTYSYKKWGFVSSVSHWDFDHLQQGKYGPDDYLKTTHVVQRDTNDVVVEQTNSRLQIPSAYSQLNLMQKVRFAPNNNWDINYGVHFSETSPYGRYDRHNRTRNQLPRYAEWKYGPQRWMMNALSIDHKHQNTFYDQLNLRLAQQTFRESRISRDFNDPVRKQRAEKVYAYSANIDFIKKINEAHTFYYGMEAVLNDVQSNGNQTNLETNETSATSSRYPQATWSSYAGYVNYLWEINPMWNIQSGLRWNLFQISADFSSQFIDLPVKKTNLNNQATTGSFGVVYRPTNTWVINTNFGTGFRAPNVDDMGKIFDSEPGAVVIPNPGLNAEYAYNIDGGFTKIIGKKLKIDLTGYYTLLDNALVRRDFNLNGQDSILFDGELSNVQAIQNAAEAHVKGIQFGLEYKLNKHWQFQSSVNYQSGEEELDDGSLSSARHAAPVFGNSRLSYLQSNWRVTLSTHFQGERRAEDMPVSEKNKDEIYAKNSSGENYSPAWAILNLNARLRVNPFVQLTGGIENILNTRYRPYSSGISGPGRNLILSVQLNF